MEAPPLLLIISITGVFTSTVLWVDLYHLDTAQPGSWTGGRLDFATTQLVLLP